MADLREGTFLVEVEESDRLVTVDASRRTAPKYPSPPPAGYESWRSFFDEVRAESKEAAEVPDSVATLLSADPEPDETGLGSSPGGLLKRTRAAGWEVEVTRSVVHHTDVLLKNDSKATGGRRGDVTTPAHEKVHWFVNGGIRAAGVGFAAHWIEGVTPKGGKSFGFQSVIVRDPAGLPVELYCNYAPKSYVIKQAPEERDDRWRERVERFERAADVMDTKYNDAASYIARELVFTAWKEFNEWVTEWLEITNNRRERDAA